jgi:drug/metabolite transporter (DMT)-like permease
VAERALRSAIFSRLFCVRTVRLPSFRHRRQLVLGIPVQPEAASIGMPPLTHRHRVPYVSVPATRSDQRAGILFIVGVTLFFSACDVAAKYLTATLPALELVWVRYVTLAVLTVPPLLLRGGLPALRSHRPRLQLLRGVCLIFSTSLYILGLRSLPIADATALSFASPLFITLLAVPFLGEKVGLARWIALGMGLFGVVLVAQPGSGAFRAAALLPLASAFCWAGGMIITRRLTGADSTPTTLAWTAVCGTLASTAVLPFNWVTPSLAAAGWALFMGVTFSIGHFLVALAYRKAAASVVAPFSYLQLLNSTLFGCIVFGAVPGPLTLLGAAVIAASGLVVIQRGRRP